MEHIRNTSKLVLLLSCLLYVAACSKKHEEPVTIAVNPWPGYAFLYLAESEGFFNKHGLNIKLAEVESLADGQRSYIHGRVDGLASTIVEAVHAHYASGRHLNVVLISDYSNGGDVILAKTPIDSVVELKGKRVGCELGSLGVFMLDRAMAKYGMKLGDVEVVHVEQTEAKDMLLNSQIDAYVTYPPVSLELIAALPLETIFSSAEIPSVVVDTVSVNNQVLAVNPKFQSQFRAAWHDAVVYFRENPALASQALAARLGMSSDEFNETLGGLTVLDGDAQIELFSDSERLRQKVLNVCESLLQTKTSSFSCESERELFTGQ